MRASLTDSWIVAMTFGELLMGSPRKRIAATRVAATKKSIRAVAAEETSLPETVSSACNCSNFPGKTDRRR